ncbi:MAG TPA: hypothetical protein VGK39_02275 [Cyclobacteriaceae bacterium]
MKRVIKFLIGGLMLLGAQTIQAQTSDATRMNRDIEVAENVLSTLIKQEFSKRNFFPVEVRGSYRDGYGVTFSVPTDVMGPMIWGSGGEDVLILDGTPGVYSYSFSTTAPEEEELAVLEKESAEKGKIKAEKEKTKAEAAQTKAAQEAVKAERSRAEGGVYKTRVEGRTARGRNQDRDSLISVTNAKMVEVAKDFLADYGDILTQLKGDERIIITNQGENQRWFYGQNAKRSILIVEASKENISQYRQGKINRDQFISKIKVTNTESSGKMEPDLELLTSIFNRLYSSDLSSSYYMNGNSYYERLTDFGAVVYMQVYSSNETEGGLWNMPTTDLRRVDQATRDKKVKELYPGFESELKENILEYGRTVKSLKDNEQLVFNVKLTKCKGCGIPADIEVGVPYSVLKDYSAGKLDKNSALSKMNVKKGAGQ